MADTKKKELTKEELEKVTGGIAGGVDDNALLTFNGKFLNNGARTCKGVATRNVLYTEQLGVATTAASKLTKLTDRNGKSMDIEATDSVTVS